jgi:hypothetical protein
LCVDIFGNENINNYEEKKINSLLSKQKKTGLGKIQKFIDIGNSDGRTQAAANFPRADFAIIYFYSHSVSVYFYQQQNENRKMKGKINRFFTNFPSFSKNIFTIFHCAISEFPDLKRKVI